MPLISKESLKSAMTTQSLSGGSTVVRMDVEGWTREFHLETIRTIVSLMLQNIDFRDSPPPDQRYSPEKDTFLTVCLPLPAKEYTNVILPVLLRSSLARDVFGINQFSCQEVANPYKDYGVLAHDLAFANTMWQGDLSLQLSPDRAATIRFRDFVGDIGSGVSYTTATGWKQRTAGHLYLAAYSLAVLPPKVWDQMRTLEPVCVQGCRVSFTSSGVCDVRPDRSPFFSRRPRPQIDFVSPVIAYREIQSGTVDTRSFHSRF